jgi:hypothetical protein
MHTARGFCSPGIEWPGHEADRSPSAEVKNEWSYTSIPQPTFTVTKLDDVILFDWRDFYTGGCNSVK